ncbi:MAG TPA: LLM class flavin-dependent oxidoreductase [Candidatus Binataceae bacterium]|nr:LLM class flavin-dependent oxidoreductase [Candidatus Binataceae bacterium]
MKKVRRFGIGIESAPAKEYVAHVRLAEQLGFGVCWVPEDLYRGAFTLAAGIASATSKIRIGLGILNPYVRHPATIAMELGALEELSGGRTVLGIGAGLRMWIEGQLGIPYNKPATAMRETIEIVRALFRGGRVDYAGKVFRISRLSLNFQPPRAVVPTHLGVLGPKNLEMAGAIADGLILSVMTTPAYARYALEHARAGAAKAGRTLDDFEVSANLFISISEDEKAARDAVRPFIGLLLSFMGSQADHPIFALAGFDAGEIGQFAQAAQQGKPLVPLVTDKFVDAFSIAGSPERCREGVARIVEAGVNSPTAFEIPGVNPEKTIRDVHDHLLPHFL